MMVLQRLKDEEKWIGLLCTKYAESGKPGIVKLLQHANLERHRCGSGENRKRVVVLWVRYREWANMDEQSVSEVRESLKMIASLNGADDSQVMIYPADEEPFRPTSSEMQPTTRLHRKKVADCCVKLLYHRFSDNPLIVAMLKYSTAEYLKKVEWDAMGLHLRTRKADWNALSPREQQELHTAWKELARLLSLKHTLISGYWQLCEPTDANYSFGESTDELRCSGFCGHFDCLD